MSIQDIANFLEEQGYPIAAIKIVPGFKTFTEKMREEESIIANFHEAGMAKGELANGDTRIYATWTWAGEDSFSDLSIVAYAGVQRANLDVLLSRLPEPRR